MLNHSLVWESTDFAHLGDIIAQVQFLHQLGPAVQHYLCSRHVCSCHGIPASRQIRAVLPLLDTKVKWTRFTPRAKPAPVFYFTRRIRIGYVKARDLPVEKKDHVTVQLHVRTDAEWPPRQPGRPGVIVRHLAGRATVYNLGDKPINGSVMFQGTLRQKLDMIATARLHVGADSGMAHLAAMTYTPTLVVCPNQYRNRYALQSNVTCYNNGRAALVVADRILDGLWPLKML